MRAKPRAKLQMIQVRGLVCQRCGYQWIPRIKAVRLCARCKTPYFDTPRPKPKVA